LLKQRFRAVSTLRTDYYEKTEESGESTGEKKEQGRGMNHRNVTKRRPNFGATESSKPKHERECSGRDRGKR